MQMIPAVLAGGGRTMGQLSSSDRCWVVAGLTLAGLTAGEIADRLHCSLRLVRSIRAEDMTALCSYVQSESRNFADELRLATSQATGARKELAAVQQELERTRRKLDNMIDAHIVGAKICPKCSTPMDRYNAYENSGKVFCRACHRDRQAQYRLRSKELAGFSFAVIKNPVR